MRRFVLPRSFLVGVCLSALCVPAGAQPQPNPRQLENHWRELRQQWRSHELNDAQSAINAYEQFYRTLLPENGEVGVAVASRVAQLYGRELGERERALEIYRTAAPLGFARAKRASATRV